MLSYILFNLSLLCLNRYAQALPASNDAAQAWAFHEIQASTSLTWTTCYTKYLCAILDVPLDYHKPAGSRAQIPLIKYAATTKPYKGMVLFNPGGPGVSSVNYLLQNGINYLTGVIGTNYDLVMWEPRGAGGSVPAANCSLSPDITGDIGFDRRETADSYFAQTPDTWYKQQYDFAQQVGKDCLTSIGAISQAGPHMVTSVVAQDMISILDAFANTTDGKQVQNASMLNYLGYSYGTFLGETFASIYPNRVGKMVLDGVNDPDDWVATGELNSSLNDADDAFATFFIYCHAAGDACAFNTGKSAVDIYQRFNQLLTRLDSTKAFGQKWNNASNVELALHGLKYISYTVTRAAISGYSHLASTLVTLEKYAADFSTVDAYTLERLLNYNPTAYVGVTDPWFYGVYCGDQNNKFYNRSLQALNTVVDGLSRQSYMGVEGLAPNAIRCSGWSIKNDDAFTGPFGANTSNPILFVSNTFDPFTPIRNGMKGTKLFPGSQLLTVDGIAHSSPQTLNKCSNKKINAYFQTGTLPGADSYCAVETGPWSVNLTQPINGTADWGAVRGFVHGLRDTGVKTRFPFADVFGKASWV